MCKSEMLWLNRWNSHLSFQEQNTAFAAGVWLLLWRRHPVTKTTANAVNVNAANASPQDIKPEVGVRAAL